MQKPWVGFLTVVAALLCVYLGIAGGVVGHDAHFPAEHALATGLFVASGAAGLVAFSALMFSGSSPEQLPAESADGGEKSSHTH